MYYHIYNRGVEQRNIFEDRGDYIRFLDYLCRFNTSDTLSHLFLDNTKTKKPLVSVLSYCLLPNHFHMLLKQLQDCGISRFLHKVQMAYAHYFNKKHHRSGRLFESTFHAKPITSNAHLDHIPRYIHLNALDLTSHNWREGLVYNWDSALSFLESYPWSSHQAYSKRNQDIQIINMEFVETMFHTKEQYIEYLKRWSTEYSSLPHLVAS